MPLAQKDLYKKLLGISGENAACKLLKKSGYRITARNFVTPFGEVDVLAWKGETLVLIEVKTRTGEEFGSASASVTPQKIQRYRQAAKWLSIKEGDVAVSFSVVEVYPKGIPEDVLTVEEKAARSAAKKPRKLPELRLIENAF